MMVFFWESLRSHQPSWAIFQQGEHRPEDISRSDGYPEKNPSRTKNCLLVFFGREANNHMLSLNGTYLLRYGILVVS